jgi:hypothetical protein
MNSRGRNGVRVRAMVAAAGLLLVGSAARATMLASGALWVADSDGYSCTAVNASDKSVAVEVKVTIDGGGGGATQSCSPLGPTSVCAAVNDAGSAHYRFCTIATSNKKATRGTFCNTTTGLCVPVQ